MKIRKVVIPIAGKGTRFLPATKETPKEMIPIVDKPMIHYAVEEAVKAGIVEVIFIVAKEKKSIENYFSPNLPLEKFLQEQYKEKELELIRSIGHMISFKTVEQKEQLGLGHALLCAEQFIAKGESFAVILGDDLILGDDPVTGQIAAVSEAYGGATVVGVMKVDALETEKYGIVDGEFIDASSKTLRMHKMVEKPTPAEAPSNLATPGRYIFNDNIFKYLKIIPKGAGNEYQLTDAINLLAQNEGSYAHIFKGDRFDTGNISGYLNATVEFALRDSKTREIMKKIIRDKRTKYNLD